MKENAIKALIDARNIEAMKKQIVLKLSTIAEFMGSPIIGEYGYSSLLPDFWEYEIEDPYDANRVVDASENMSQSNLGWSYDSLRHGINFEIVVRTYAEKITLLRASYNGNAVFLEEDGILVGYAPEYIWEQHMEDLYTHAKKIESDFFKKESINEIEKNKTKKKGIIEQLRLIWGFK